MAEREPVAFLSYVRSDDKHDDGRISELRERLEGEVKIQTGRSFHIFQDRNDIRWGQQWKERIEDALLDVTFLIPIVTPNYFQSHACKKEFETFRVRERTLGENRLILPIYYVTSDEIEGECQPPNEMAEVLKSRNWADWRNFRFESLTSPRLREEVASLAKTIKSTMKDLVAVFAASEATPRETPSSLDTAISTKSASDKGGAAYSPVVPVVRAKHFSQRRLDQISKSPYYAYTTSFDEVITPSEISEPADTMKYHSFLLDHVRQQITQSESEIANWTKELTKIGKGDNLAISFLIDNSGSLRGSRILGVSCWASIVASNLSQAMIPCEILGFTTKAWKGGRSREQWILDGKPANPGRLNELRHIIYKGFDETFQEADTNFGLMLREGLLKENIDGESLLWAQSRLREYPAQRKMLFVLSDGAPVDDSTLSVNPATFLDAHLVATINWIRSETEIELYGVGLEHDVARYYGKGAPTLGPHVGIDLLKVILLAATKRWPEAGLIQWVPPPLTPKIAPPPSRYKRRKMSEKI